MATKDDKPVAVTVEDFGKDPERYFGEQPVPVVEGDKTLGYAVGPELFAAMMAVCEQVTEDTTVRAQFRPSGEELKAMAKRCSEALLTMDPKGAGDFSE